MEQLRLAELRPLSREPIPLKAVLAGRRSRPVAPRTRPRRQAKPARAPVGPPSRCGGGTARLITDAPSPTPIHDPRSGDRQAPGHEASPGHRTGQQRPPQGRSRAGLRRQRIWLTEQQTQGTVVDGVAGEVEDGERGAAGVKTAVAGIAELMSAAALPPHRRHQRRRNRPNRPGIRPSDGRVRGVGRDRRGNRMDLHRQLDPRTRARSAPGDRVEYNCPSCAIHQVSGALAALEPSWAATVAPVTRTRSAEHQIGFTKADSHQVFGNGPTGHLDGGSQPCVTESGVRTPVESARGASGAFRGGETHG